MADISGANTSNTADASGAAGIWRPSDEAHLDDDNEVRRLRTGSIAVFDHNQSAQPEFGYSGTDRFQTHRMTMSQVRGPIPESAGLDSKRILRRMSSVQAIGVDKASHHNIQLQLDAGGTSAGATDSAFHLDEVIKMRQDWERAHSNISVEEQWIKEGRERGFLKADNRYSKRSIGFLNLNNPFRLRIIKFVESNIFDKFILLVIMVNMVFLLLDNPLNPLAYSQTAELIFLIIFVVEAVLKIIAFGFIKESTTYLRSPWNGLDFVIIVTGLLPYLADDLGNYTGIRALRVLRPLRTLTHIKGLRIMINAMLQSIPMLIDVMALTLMFFVVFGILAIQLFSGSMHNRCYTIPTTVAGWANPVMVPDNDERICGNDTTSHRCPTGQVCLMIPSVPNVLNSGVTNFDHFGFALLTLFQSITLEGWTDLMYTEMDSVGWPSIVFFIVLVMFGSFFLINLALAVIADNFSNLSQAKENIVGDGKKTSRRWYHIITKPVVKGLKGAGTFCGKFHFPEPVVKFFNAVATSKYFTNIVVFAILCNVVALAMEYQDPIAPMPHVYDYALTTANLVFTFFFIAEMVVKMVGLGITGYWRDSFNRFDFVVVLVSILELFVSSSSAFSALRAFRVLRILKLVRSWKGLRRLVNVIYSSFTALAWFVLILGLFLLIYTVLGMQMFGGFMKGPNFPDGRPRTNFDSAFNGFLTVFITLTGENWNSIMYDGILAVGPVAILYFVTLVIIGNFILFNLFLAILLENFAESQRDRWEKMKQKRRAKAKLKSKAKKLSFVGKMLASRKRGQTTPSISSADNGNTNGNGNDVDYDAENIEMSTFSAAATSVLRRGATDSSLVNNRKKEGEGGSESDHTQIPLTPDPSTPGLMREVSTLSDVTQTQTQTIGSSDELLHMHMQTPGSGSVASITLDSTGSPDSMYDYDEDQDPDQENDDTEMDDRETEKERKNAASAKEMSGNSCLILSPENPIRILAWKICTHKSFEWIMLFFILGSSLALAIEGPHVANNHQLSLALFILDIVWVVVFTLEMILKMIAFGVYHSETAYFRDKWNGLDFIIVIIAWVSLFIASGGVKALRVLRSLRALRPLRLLSKSGGMRAVMNTLFQAMPSIANAIVVCLTFWIIFAIIGVQMLGGRNYKCNDGVTMTQSDCTGVFNTTSGTVARAWETPMMNFDNFGTSLLLLFQIVSLEGWPDIMYEGIDVTSVGHAPVEGHSPWFGLFFILFVIFGSFFMVNIFVGVVIDTFSRIQAETSGESLMTREQNDWVKTQKELVRAKPIKYYEEPESPIRLVAFFIAFHRFFDRGIIGVIILNAIQMGLEHYPMSKQFVSFMDIANIVFTVIYVIEFVIKILGMGPKHYFEDVWNRLDFVVVVSSIIDIFFPDAVGFVKVLRIMRIARIFKLIRRAEGVRSLLQTLYFSFPSLWNVGLLLTMFFFMYSVMGVALFSEIKLNGSYNEHANFRSFGTAMLLLFRVSTGEDWQALMEGLRVQPPNCQPDVPFEDCGSDFSILYFVSFILVVGFVLLNLFIAIILEQFSTTQEEESLQIKPMDVKLFSLAWARYDHNASATIHLDLLIPLLRELGPPLGLTGRSSEHTRIRMLRSLDIPVQPDGEIHFLHTLRGLIKRCVAAGDIDKTLSHEVEIGVMKDLQKQLRKVLPEVEESQFNVAEWAAAKLLQRSWRATSILRREKRIEAMRLGVGKKRIKPHKMKSQSHEHDS